MTAAARRPLVAGVDSSTQSCTVELRDADTGALRGTGRAPHPATFPPVSEQHPAVWWQAFVTALAGACAEAQTSPTAIGAISVGAQCHAAVLLDDHDEVIRPAKLWNDTTSAPQATRLVDRFGAANWVRAIGLTPTAALTVTKLAWFADHEPDTLQRTASVLLPHDWLTFRLTGRRVTDRSDASGTGYYAATESSWRTDLLDELVAADVAWSELLPEVLGPDDVAGRVLPGVAAELGLDRKVVVAAGGGDQHLGAVGLGLRPGDVAYSLGTSGVVLATSPDAVHDLTGWVDGVADATGHFLPLVCTLNSAKVTDTFARLLGVDVVELGRLALACPVTAPRPTLLAYLDGERTPARPHAEGLLGGLTNTLSREALALAAFEGVIAGLVRGHDALTAAGVTTDGDIVATGGGARSPAYRQVLADMLGRPVTTRDVAEATARGACVQATAALSGASIVDIRDRWQPLTQGTTAPRADAAAGVPERYLQLAALTPPSSI
ncbi:xylulokinase [Nakamurella deserti]|uniref:xylulokinase n=1 Tax=Nakamurella deserti TaxID=2164074 RepID=UPI000DBE8CB1|nr:xylulokinase [Nakamurella deserti]